MSEGWSVNDENPWIPRKLIPSNGLVSHPDPRMHLTIKDMKKSYNPPLISNPNPPELSEGMGKNIQND